MIMDYNATKGGVDTVDQLCSRYTVQRSTRRWSLSVFFGLLDIIGINAMVIHNLNNPATLSTKRGNRRYFLEQLALELVTEHAQERTKTKTLAKPIRDAAVRCGFATYPTVHNQDHQERKRKRYHYCPSSADRKVRTQCSGCGRHVCPEHGQSSTVTVVCVECVWQFIMTRECELDETET
jgi:hypothetical protein